MYTLRTVLTDSMKERENIKPMTSTALWEMSKCTHSHVAHTYTYCILYRIYFVYLYQFTQTALHLNVGHLLYLSNFIEIGSSALTD